MILKNCLFYKKNLLFYFTPLLLRSIPSIYLFYTLFYLNNIFFSHFFIISHLPTTPPTFNTHHSLFLFLWTPPLSFSHSPSFFPSSFFFFLLLLLLLFFNLGMTMGVDFGFAIWVWFWVMVLGGFLRYCEWWFWTNFRQISSLLLLLLLLHLLLLPFWHFLLLLLLLHFWFH